MAAQIQTLRPAPTSPAPERAALAAAIDRRDASAGYLERIQNAMPNAQHQIHRAMEAVDAATEVQAKAKTDEPRLVAAAFLGDAVTGVTVELADAALEAANAELARLRRGRDALREQELVAERDLEEAAHVLKQAIQAIVQPSPNIAALLAELAEARRRVATLTTLLNFLGGRGMLPRSAAHWDAIPEVTPAVLVAQRPALAPWEAALAALESDPAAMLPGEAEASPPAAAE
jgi:hypothetical protein